MPILKPGEYVWEPELSPRGRSLYWRRCRPVFVEQSLGAMHPGMSLMITDIAAGPETRSDRDFVIVTSEYVQSYRVPIHGFIKGTDCCAA